MELKMKKQLQNIDYTFWMFVAIMITSSVVVIVELNRFMETTQSYIIPKNLGSTYLTSEGAKIMVFKRNTPQELQTTALIEDFCIKNNVKACMPAVNVLGLK